MEALEPAAIALREAIDRGVMPGAALAFGQADRTWFSHVCGCAALVPQAQPLELGTLFDLASLTKVLCTGLLVARLVGRGQVDLDAPLGALLPGCYPPDKEGLTLRLLLAHAAGLPAHVPFYHQWPAETEDPALRRRQVIERVRSTALAYVPAQESRYSDLGFMLVGDLVEQLAGERLDRLFESQLGIPLALADTFFLHGSDPLPKARRPGPAFAATEQCPWRGRMIRGQVHDENAYLMSGVAGHAGLFSTLGDVTAMARCLLAAVARGALGLPASVLAEFARRQDLVPGSSRALGWDTPSTGASCGQRFTSRAFGHTGFTGTSIWLDPEQDRFVVLLSNRVHPTRENTAFLEFRPRVHDLVHGLMDAA